MQSRNYMHQYRCGALFAYYIKSYACFAMCTRAMPVKIESILYSAHPLYWAATLGEDGVSQEIHAPHLY